MVGGLDIEELQCSLQAKRPKWTPHTACQAEASGQLEALFVLLRAWERCSLEGAAKTTPVAGCGENLRPLA